MGVWGGGEKNIIVLFLWNVRLILIRWTDMREFKIVIQKNVYTNITNENKIVTKLGNGSLRNNNNKSKNQLLLIQQKKRNKDDGQILLLLFFRLELMMMMIWQYYILYNLHNGSHYNFECFQRLVCSFEFLHHLRSTIIY